MKQEASRPPAEGERAARRGYFHQDTFSAIRIYAFLSDRSLEWVGIADRSAGVFDDLVLCVKNEILAHQLKSSVDPQGLGIKSLLLGTGCEIQRLASSFQQLRSQFPSEKIRLLYVTEDYPATKDKLVKGSEATNTAVFIREFDEHRNRALQEWNASKWATLIKDLKQKSGLTDAEFEDFFQSLELVMGADATKMMLVGEDKFVEQQIKELAKSIQPLIAQNKDKDRWTRTELLEELNWPDRFKLRFEHRFPLGTFVQRNELTEQELFGAINRHPSGYVSLVGSPGSGKSTLLQRALRDRPGLNVLRFLAFVPGMAQGQGRGEADIFYDDLNSQFAAILPGKTRLYETSRQARQQLFESMLERAGQEHKKNGKRFIVVVDGLDHIPREELPDRSLLAALPLPQSIPDGIVFVLGTQRIDLKDMPASVKSQSSQRDRQVDIKPLSVSAISVMTDQLGLSIDIDRAQIFKATMGHPLVARYLIERLRVNPAEITSLQKGFFSFGGDIQNVYEAAWRNIEQSKKKNDVKRVLKIIAHAQGAIEPELLSKATSEDAVEATLTEVGHLLNAATGHWTVFHNSFRLFLQTKNVPKYGKPDKTFQAPQVYSTLAELSKTAGPTSAQRWLTFRYLFLAGERKKALDIADREYFTTQYISGRSAYEVRGDISDAYRLIREFPDAAKLFDLMLADDEVYRRATVMEAVNSLVDAHLATGQTQKALVALEDTHPVGKELLVIDNLISNGRIDEARNIFELEEPFGSAFSDANSLSGSGYRPALEWARRAVIFLNNDLLQRSLEEYLEDIQEDNRKNSGDEELEEIKSILRFQIGRAIVERTSFKSLSDIIHQWSSEPIQSLILEIIALKKVRLDDPKKDVIESLKRIAENKDFCALHLSWQHAVATMALRAGGVEIAKGILQNIVPESIDNNKQRLFETAGPACRSLAHTIELLLSLDLPIPEICRPEERLLRGSQHHVIHIASAIGKQKSGASISPAEVFRISSEALRFLASARTLRDEDWATSHWMPNIAVEIARLLIKLFKVSDAESEVLVKLYDDFISQEKTLFRWWPAFRREMSLGLFRLDNNKPVAHQRLNAALGELQTQDPQEELEERAQFAVAFARAGDVEKANDILSSLRSRALGSFLPAKKDGQYELWANVLEHANIEDPNNRASRATTALRLIDGLENTGGYDSGRRIAEQFLFEAAASDAQLAWNAAKWASDCGAYSWFGILDACLRGVLHRDNKQAKTILTVWLHLCLPWHGSAWRGTVETGQFFKDLFKVADISEVDQLETAAVKAIGISSPPDEKVNLLRILEEEALKRGFGQRARTASIRWRCELKTDESQDPESRSYGHLKDFDNVSTAIKQEQRYHKSKEEEWNASGVSYDLRKAITRIVSLSTWADVEAFIAKNPKLVKEWDVAVSVAELAVKSGKKSTAKMLLERFSEDADEGWSWPSSRGRYRHHQIRHIIGGPNIHEDALTDFIESVVAARYGVSSTLWSLDEIFPLLFENVPWPALWDRLEPNIRASRDYQAGEMASAAESVENDEQLLSELLHWALMLGAIDVHRQGVFALLEVLDIGNTEVFEQVLDRLLAGNTEKQMVAMDILVRVKTNSFVEDHFGHRMPDLSQNTDLGIASTASYLGAYWGQNIGIRNEPLPAFYSIEIPDPEPVKGNPLTGEHTRGLIIDDPLAWTENWERVVHFLAKWSDIPKLKIRYRAARLITLWGGVEIYGHQGSEKLEQSLSVIDMKLIYRRPQAEVVMRALRFIARELWVAGRIDYNNFRFLLHELHVDPDRVEVPNWASRPKGITWPEFPRMMWGDTQKQWLDAIKNDLEFSGPPDEIVVAEWRQWVIRETRKSSIVEQWFGDANVLDETGNLDSAISNLNRVVRVGTLIPLFEENEACSPPVACFHPHNLQVDTLQIIVFCPFAAEKLGWRCSNSNPFVYYDKSGQKMSGTSLWREGFPQQIESDEKYAVGQRITLTAKGKVGYEKHFGSIKLSANAWRRVEATKGDGDSESRYAEKPDVA